MFNKLNHILENNKIFTAAKIDGFLAAIISSPNLIHPLEWTQIVRIEDFNLEILFEFYNQVYLGLREGNYLPSFIDSEIEDLSMNIDKWIDGYILGKNLWDPKIVKIYQVAIDKLFSRITQCSSKQPIKIPDNRINILSKTCIDIYRFWSINHG